MVFIYITIKYNSFIYLYISILYILLCHFPYLVHLKTLLYPCFGFSLPFFVTLKRGNSVVFVNSVNGQSLSDFVYYLEVLVLLEGKDIAAGKQRVVQN